MIRTAPTLLFGASLAALCSGIMALGKEDDRSSASRPPAKPNFAEHVAPILYRSCVECHRPGEVAPFSLVGYENAKKWAAMVATVAKARQMPPWKAVEGFGEFVDANRLTQTEIDTIQRWAADGAPRGPRAKEPAPPKFAGEWSLGPPDLVLMPEREFKIADEGADVYRNFILKTSSKEPMWVKAMDIKPGNAKVVHHVIAFLDNSGASHRLEQRAGDGQPGYSSFGGVGFLPSGSLGGWAPGLRARILPPGTAFRVEPGATIVMQVHYHPSGKPETDRTKLGLYLAKEPIEKEMQLAWYFNFGLDIPPGEKAHRVRLERTMPVDVTLHGVMPHMHLLGRSMKAHLEHPDGRTEPLVHVADWDFNWQLNYVYKKPIKAPKGSKVVIEAIYDNSANNPHNPNRPPKRVRWGEQTTDEMFLMIFAFTRD